MGIIKNINLAWCLRGFSFNCVFVHRLHACVYVCDLDATQHQTATAPVARVSLTRFRSRAD